LFVLPLRFVLGRRLDGSGSTDGEVPVHAPRRVTLTLTFTLLLTVGVVPFAAAETPPPNAITEELPLDEVALEIPAEAQDPAEAGPDAAPSEATEGAEDPEAAAGEVAEGEADTPRRTEPIEAPIAFTSVWAELPEAVETVSVRTSVDGSDWSAWVELEAADELDAPDAGTEEAAAADAAPRVSDHLWAEEARFVQLETPAGSSPRELSLTFADTDGLNESVIARVSRQLTPRGVPAEAATVPNWIQRRSAWGAAAYKGTPSVASGGVRQVVVHHTAGQNNLDDCNRARIISTIKNIQHYHQNALGWSDIGYNLLVDPCGGIWEGRAGGVNRAVVGAHAANHNTGSTGISVLGNFTLVQPRSQILSALDRVVGYKAGIHGVNPTGSVTVNGRSLPTVVGHQNVGNTACPGSIQNQLWRVRSNSAKHAASWRYGFSDVAGHAHASAIKQVADRRIATGYANGTFRPNRAVTRAQIATFIGRTMGYSPVSGSRYRDVPSNHGHAGYINALASRGIMTGYADGRFRPSDPLSREHMAVVLTRALGLSRDSSAASRFSDVRSYRGEIGAIAKAGIASGYADGRYRPKRNVSRGQMATFLVNVLKRR
jgi:hypothetical protein